MKGCGSRLYFLKAPGEWRSDWSKWIQTWLESGSSWIIKVLSCDFWRFDKWCICPKAKKHTPRNEFAEPNPTISVVPVQPQDKRKPITGRDIHVMMDRPQLPHFFGRCIPTNQPSIIIFTAGLLGPLFAEWRGLLPRRYLKERCFFLRQILLYWRQPHTSDLLNGRTGNIKTIHVKNWCLHSSENTRGTGLWKVSGKGGWPFKKKVALSQHRGSTPPVFHPVGPGPLWPWRLEAERAVPSKKKATASPSGISFSCV